jgi:hypothetical protein
LLGNLRKLGKGMAPSLERRPSILRYVMLMLSGISVEKCCRAAGQAKARVRRAEGDRGTKGLRAWHHVLTAAANPTELTLSGISVEKCCRAAGQAKGRGAGSESGRRLRNQKD